MGFEIFTRERTGVTMTPKGQELLTHYQTIQQECLILEKLKDQEQMPPRIHLRAATLNTARLPNVIIPIVKRYQKSPINFSLTNFTNFEDLIKNIVSNRVDFAIVGIVSPYVRSVRVILKNEEIEYHPIKKVLVCILAGKTSPFYERQTSVQLEELYSHIIVSYSGISEDTSYSISLAAGIEHKVQGHIHVNSSHLFYQLIQETEVIGLVAAEPQNIVSNPWKDIRAIPVENCPVSVELAWIKLRRVPSNSIITEILESFEQLN